MHKQLGVRRQLVRARGVPGRAAVPAVRADAVPASELGEPAAHVPAPAAVVSNSTAAPADVLAAASIDLPNDDLREFCREYYDAEGYGVDGYGDDYRCAPGCKDGWPGNGECDEECDNAACEWDLGDCRLSGCAPGCHDGWPGDHYCDNACNNAACEWDLGDCAPAPPSKYPTSFPTGPSF